jgi:hypothetical protein
MNTDKGKLFCDREVQASGGDLVFSPPLPSFTAASFLVNLGKRSPDAMLIGE